MLEGKYVQSNLNKWDKVKIGILVGFLNIDDK